MSRSAHQSLNGGESTGSESFTRRQCCSVPYSPLGLLPDFCQHTGDAGFLLPPRGLSQRIVCAAIPGSTGAGENNCSDGSILKTVGRSVDNPVLRNSDRSRVNDRLELHVQAITSEAAASSPAWRGDGSERNPCHHPFPVCPPRRVSGM